MREGHVFTDVCLLTGSTLASGPRSFPRGEGDRGGRWGKGGERRERGRVPQLLAPGPFWRVPQTRIGVPSPTDRRASVSLCKSEVLTENDHFSFLRGSRR